MKLRQQLLRTLVAWLVLGVFVTLLQPDKLPVVVLIVPFLLLYLVLYETWCLIDAVRLKFAAQPNTVRPRKRLGAGVSAGIVLLLVLQSLGQLSLRDVVTVLAITILGYMYIVRNRPSLDKNKV